MKIKFSRLTSLLLASLFLNCAHANMTVYPMALGLDNKGEGSVRIISKSNDVQFIKTTVYKIDQPGTPQEKEIPVSTKDASALVVMPPLFAIPGGSSKLVRMISMEPTEKEVMYRVKFEGVPSPDGDESATQKTSVATHLSVSLVWGVLVSAPPVTPTINLALSPDHHQVMNQGTQRVKITGVGLCLPGQKNNQCHWIEENKNIFPDGSYSLPKDSGYNHVVLKYNDWIKKTSDNTIEFDLP
ncbi:fimbria/pilus periplasmic chaperone [Edaphovirga cremea]|uniref:fimbria/pilus periplasmic chaperone n=1 Tax=Edaphovirga cremea TaxID=2267246 RepID=UPI0013006F1B|nr:fimbria/pilus periplasmic chaperone [Edaphovirga cremea]